MSISFGVCLTIDTMPKCTSVEIIVTFNVIMWVSFWKKKTIKEEGILVTFIIQICRRELDNVINKTRKTTKRQDELRMFFQIFRLSIQIDYTVILYIVDAPMPLLLLQIAAFLMFTSHFFSLIINFGSLFFRQYIHHKEWYKWLKWYLRLVKFNIF